MSQLPPPIQAVIELFQGPLADVRFADVDAAGLSNLAHAVDAAAVAVAEQEAQLAELRQTLSDRQEALLVLAQRALAYARVYAEHDEALSEQLARVALPRAAKPRKASTKAAGSEPAAALTPEPEVTAEEGIAAASADEAVPEANLEPPALETPALETPAPAPRKGKRRSNATPDEAHTG